MNDLLVLQILFIWAVGGFIFTNLRIDSLNKRFERLDRVIKIEEKEEKKKNE